MYMKMQRIFVLLAVVLAAAGAQAQIFYRVSGNGLKEPSYLFGCLLYTSPSPRD